MHKMCRTVHYMHINLIMGAPQNENATLAEIHFESTISACIMHSNFITVLFIIIIIRKVEVKH